MNNELRIMEDMKKNTERGAATIELLIALAVGVIFITGATLVSFGAQTSGLDTGLTNEGLRLAELGTADTVASVASAWNAATEINDGDFYQTKSEIKDVNKCLKRVSTATGWASEKNRSLSVGMNTLVANWTEAKKSTGCSNPPGGWDSPGTRGFADLSPSGIQGTGIDVDYINGSRYVFMSSFHSAVGTNDFWVINADNPQAPTIIYSMNTGKGLNKIDVADGYAYVAVDDDHDQLLIIDVNNPSAPFEVSRVTLPGVGTSYPQGWSIRYFDNKLYIATRETAGHEFHIFDVEVPSFPVWLGSMEINHNVNDIEVADQMIGGILKTVAYLATSVTSASAPELTVLDVTTPSSIALLGTFNPSGIKYGTDLYLRNETLFLGLEKAVGGEKDFFIIDISNPTAPTEVGSVKLGLNGASAAVTSLSIQGDYAFIGTSDPNAEFQVWSIANPLLITKFSTCAIFNFPQEVAGLVYADNLLFASIRSNEALRIMHDTPAVCP